MRILNWCIGLFPSNGWWDCQTIFVTQQRQRHKLAPDLPSFYNRIIKKILFNKIYFCYLSEIISSQTVPGLTNVWVTTTSAPSSSGTTTARPTRPTWRPKCCSQPRGEWARATSCKEKPSPGNLKWEAGVSKSQWVETNQSNFRIKHTDIYLSLPHGTTLKALIWMLRMLIQMFADVRWVGFLPPFKS